MAKKYNVRLGSRLFPIKSNKSSEQPESRTSDTVLWRGDEVLQQACDAWQKLDSFRRQASRNKQFTFGDQWSDRIRVGNETMTERQHIIRQGSIPFQNNRIRSIIRSIVGVFQNNRTEPVCVARDNTEQAIGETMSSTLQYVYQQNRLWGIDSLNLQYLCVTGLAAFRNEYGWKNDRMDVWSSLVNCNNFFFDNIMEDSRTWDCTLVGEFYDAGLYDVVAQYSHGSRARADRIKSIYGNCSNDALNSYYQTLIDDKKIDLEFLTSSGGLCRVIVVWRRESCERLLVHDPLTGEYYKTELSEAKALEAENIQRAKEWRFRGVDEQFINSKMIAYEWFVDNRWRYYALSPYGDILDQGETPYAHKSHPYSFRVYPFFDGQVFPLVSDFIDQQKLINNIIITQNFILRASAKGVLAIDETAIPDGYTVKDIADEWAVFNGVILYTTKKNPNAHIPQQIVANSIPVGMTEMLSVQLKMLEDISGVQGALQGRSPGNGTAASLYAQQAQNSSITLMEIFDTYRELREERDGKLLKLIQQYYTEPRYINIAGSKAQAVYYDPQKVGNIDFDLSIIESQSTPAYSMIANEFLMQIFSAGQITLEEMLEAGNFPFGDKLLQSVKARAEQMQQAAAGAQIPQGGGQPPLTAGAPATDNPLIAKMLSNQNSNLNLAAQ